MTTKQKIISGASAAALTVASVTGALLYDGTDTTTENTTTQYEQYVEDNEGTLTLTVEETEETEGETTDETEALTEEETENRSTSWSWGRTETTETDVLEPYRSASERNGTTIHYYNGVPFELQGEIFNTLSTFSTGTYDLSDIAVMENYIFINTAGGLKYISDISRGDITDESIQATDFSGYNVFINTFIEEPPPDFKPIKSFSGFLYGNDYLININTYLFENFNGELQRLSINTTHPIAQFSENGKISECEFYITSSEDFSENMGIIGTAVNAKIQNVRVELNCCGKNAGGIFGEAAGECFIENCIVNGDIKGENVGSFIGLLKNQITLKNNIAQTSIICDIGYGGKAVGYVDYEYKDDIDRINGAYCETSLTVEGLESELFIGNISEPVPELVEKNIYAYEDITEEVYKDAAAVCYGKDGTVITVYNLALIPSEYPILKEYIAGTYYEAEFDEDAPEMSGYYDFSDLTALNQYATANDLKKFYEENGLVYFESEEASDEGVYFNNLVYSGGDCVAFIQGEFEGGTLIIVSYKGNQMHSYTTHDVNGAGTYFTSIEDSENITDVKAMLWTSIDGMQPICEARSINTILNGVDEDEY